MVLFRIAAKGLFSLLRLFHLGGSMEEYKLEIKQIIDYPRCRMHRQFVRGLIEDIQAHMGVLSVCRDICQLCSRFPT